MSIVISESSYRVFWRVSRFKKHCVARYNPTWAYWYVFTTEPHVIEEMLFAVSSSDLPKKEELMEELLECL